MSLVSIRIFDFLQTPHSMADPIPSNRPKLVARLVAHKLAVYALVRVTS